MTEHKEAFNKEIEELKAQVRKQDSLIEKYKEDISRKDEEINKKTSEIVDITKERDLYKVELEKYKSNDKTVRYLDNELQQEQIKVKEQCDIIENLKKQLESKEHIAPFLNSISKSIDIIAESKANEKVYDFAKILVDEENKELKEQQASNRLKIKELDLNIEQLKFDNRSLITERANLCNEIEEAHKKIEKLEEDKKLFEASTKKEFELKEKQFVEERRKIENELQEHKALYSDIDKLYELYKLLHDDVKDKLQNCFGKGDSRISILVNITIYRNLESFWQYICDKIERNEFPEQIENCKKIFDIAFRLLRIGDNNYERLDIHEGESFSRSSMRVMTSSKQVGSVQKVLLQGFKYSATNRVMKQSLVSLG